MTRFGAMLGALGPAALVWMAGCSQSTSTLALGGYQSLELVDVRVTGEVPYAADKLEGKIRFLLAAIINQSVYWSARGDPVAEITVLITGYHDFSTATRVVLGVAPTLDFTIEARDAESGQPLGTYEGRAATRTVVMPGGVLTGGATALAANLAWERNTPLGVEDSAMISTLTQAVHSALIEARSRAAPAVVIRRHQTALVSAD